MEIELRIIEIPEEWIFDEGKSFYTQRKRIKEGNVIWCFHKYDKDPFPCTPHGHDYESNTKLNPYTGEIFDKSKQIVRHLKKKQILYIQEHLIKAGFVLNS